MISDIGLNPAAGEDDIVNVLIVCNLSSFEGSYWCRSDIFGHDNSSFDKFVSSSPQGDLIVSATSPTDHLVIGQNTTNGQAPIADYKTKASSGELNKWVCLSIHSNLPSEMSYVYCNGKKLCDVTSRTSPGANHVTFGEINPSGIAPMYGNIAAFLLYRGMAMTNRDIKLHHHVFCSKWYNIDHDPITL